MSVVLIVHLRIWRFHTVSLQKMRKRRKSFEAPKERQGRGEFQGSSAVQADSVVDSTLEIIDISGVPKSARSEVHVAAAESSSPHGGRHVGVHAAVSEMVRYTPLLLQLCVQLGSKVVMNHTIPLQHVLLAVEGDFHPPSSHEDSVHATDLPLTTSTYHV
jgi:hypothetical protein